MTSINWSKITMIKTKICWIVSKNIHRIVIALWIFQILLRIQKRWKREFQHIGYHRGSTIRYSSKKWCNQSILCSNLSNLWMIKRLTKLTSLSLLQECSAKIDLNPTVIRLFQLIQWVDLKVRVQTLKKSLLQSINEI